VDTFLPSTAPRDDIGRQLRDDRSTTSDSSNEQSDRTTNQPGSQHSPTAWTRHPSRRSMSAQPSTRHRNARWRSISRCETATESQPSPTRSKAGPISPADGSDILTRRCEQPARLWPCPTTTRPAKSSTNGPDAPPSRRPRARNRRCHDRPDRGRPTPSTRRRTRDVLGGTRSRSSTPSPKQ